MNYRLLREGFVSSDKQHSEEVYRNESLWRDDAVSDYFHDKNLFRDYPICFSVRSSIPNNIKYSIIEY